MTSGDLQLKSEIQTWFKDALSLITKKIDTERSYSARTVPASDLDEKSRIPTFRSLIQIIDWEYHILDYFRAIKVAPIIKELPTNELQNQLPYIRRQYGFWTNLMGQGLLKEPELFERVNQNQLENLLWIYCRMKAGPPQCVIIANPPLQMPSYPGLFQWDEKRFETAYKECLVACDTRTPRFARTSAIWGLPFTITHEEKLDDDITIRKPLDEEIVAYGFGKLSNRPNPEPGWSCPVPAIVEKVYFNENDYLQDKEDFSWLQSLLNLCGSYAKVTSSLHVRIAGNFRKISGVVTQERQPRLPKAWRGDQISLVTLKKRLIASNTANKTGRFEKSLLWFSRSLQADDLEEKLIYLAIAGEALLLEGTHELGFRLRLYIAHLCASLDNPILIAQIVKEFYNLRSGLLHGQFKTIDKAWRSVKHSVRIKFGSIHAFLSAIEDYIRKCLRTYVTLVGNDKTRLRTLERLAYGTTPVPDLFEGSALTRWKMETAC